MRPNPVTTQVSVMEYYKDYVIGNASIHMNEHSNLVAVHVRRGDYISDSKQKLHGRIIKTQSPNRKWPVCNTCLYLC